MRSFTIDVHGHPYRGLWRLDGADGVEMRSDYGTVWAKLAGRQPGDVARQLLAGVIPGPARDAARTGRG